MTTMMMATGNGHDATSFSTTNNNNDDDNHGLKKKSHTLSTTLSKMNSVVTTSLHRSIRQGKDVRMNNKSQQEAITDNKTRNDAPLVDYLTVKNSLMISYLIDLTLMLRFRLASSADDCNQDSVGRGQQEQKECLERLREMKVALEKMRPLEKKMRYQIDKLLALSTVLSDQDRSGGIGGGGSAGMFASVGREVDDEEDARQEKNGGNSLDSDPLSYKPDLRGMMKNMFVGEDDEENEDYDTREGGGGGNNHDDIDMKSNRAKIFLDKEDTSGTTSSSVYQPPRLQSVPFELDNSDRMARKLERNLEKKRERQSRSELTQVIKSQFTDAPEEEDARGGASLGLQSDRSRKISSRNAELEAFEEGHMMRLSVGRKEKKERKRMMREEMSNLGAIADGLGNVVSGVDDAFGGGRKRTTATSDGGAAGRGGTQEAYKTMGMRRRKVDVIDHEGVARKKKKSATYGNVKNTYQKSLYGGGGGMGGGKSRK